MLVTNTNIFILYEMPKLLLTQLTYNPRYATFIILKYLFSKTQNQTKKPNLNLFNEFILKLTKPKTNYDKCFKYYKLFEIRLNEKQKKNMRFFTFIKQEICLLKIRENPA